LDIRATDLGENKVSERVTFAVLAPPQRSDDDSEDGAIPGFEALLGMIAMTVAVAHIFRRRRDG
jgi:hypothetical protein